MLLLQFGTADKGSFREACICSNVGLDVTCGAENGGEIGALSLPRIHGPKKPNLFFWA